MGVWVGFAVRHAVALALLGVFTTAVAGTMWVDGVTCVYVQPSTILGLVAGGALILSAGALVVARGAGEPEPHL